MLGEVLAVRIGGHKAYVFPHRDILILIDTAVNELDLEKSEANVVADGSDIGRFYGCAFHVFSLEGQMVACDVIFRNVRVSAHKLAVNLTSFSFCQVGVCLALSCVVADDDRPESVSVW
tara:strand:- start:764 stop:1120 length:357 start_codon:yes stop_codon:yes gene_type:complete